MKLPTKYQFFQWAFWNFLGVRLIALILGVGQLFGFLSLPTEFPWGAFWAQQPIWFLYIQVLNGGLTFLAYRLTNRVLKTLVLLPTFILLPIATFVGGLNFYPYTHGIEYRYWTLELIVLPYLLVQAGYLVNALRKRRITAEASKSKKLN